VLLQPLLAPFSHAVAHSTRKNSVALIVSMESMTQNWYLGNERSMMISNCIFRVGCSAVLLTNRRSLAKRAKFELSHVVRTHTGRDDEAYTSVYQCEVGSCSTIDDVLCVLSAMWFGCGWYRTLRECLVYDWLAGS